MELTVLPWQEMQWQRLQQMRRNGRLPHAMLFTGPEGVGIEQFLSATCASIMCERDGEALSCGNCRACLLFRSGNHPDFQKIEPDELGKAIKVDQIRDLLEFIHLKSQYGSDRIAVITPADAMNRNAANALLKSLEEPPAGVLIVLISSFPGRLPVTIRSRCQRLQFFDVEARLARDWLEKQSAYDNSYMSEMLDLAPGRPLLALQQGEGETLQNQRQVLADLAEIGSPGGDIVRTARRWQDYGTDQVFRWIMGFMRLCTHLKLQILDKSLEVSANNPTLQGIAAKLSMRELIVSYDLALDQYHAVTGAFNLNRIGLIEDFLIHWRSMMNQEEAEK